VDVKIIGQEEYVDSRSYVDIALFCHGFVIPQTCYWCSSSAT